MSYSTGILNKRITIVQRTYTEGDAFGKGSGGEVLTDRLTVWAAVDFTRGLKAMREGAMDAYDTVMVRLRWHPAVTRDMLLRIDGVMYEIQSFHAERQRDTIQITATEQPYR